MSDLEFKFRYELRDIPTHLIRFDSGDNPRNIKPSAELIRQIEETGINEPVTTYENHSSSTYPATDGWQRTAAALLLGLPTVPCRVFATRAQAQMFAIQTETRTPETDLEKYNRFNFLYCSLVDEGMSHQEALEIATRHRGLSRQDAGQRRLDIFNLPPVVLYLMKDWQNRTEDELKRLEKDIPNIRRKRNKLNLLSASTMGRLLSDRSENELLTVASFCMKLKYWDGVGYVQEVAAYPNKTPSEVYREIYDTQHTEKIVIPIYVSKLEKNRLNKLCEAVHLTITQLVAMCLNLCYNRWSGKELWEIKER